MDAADPAVPPHASCRLGIGHGCPSDVSFYSTQPHKSFRIVFADGCVDYCGVTFLYFPIDLFLIVLPALGLPRYDVSVLGWPEGHPLREEAVALLNKNNPNPVRSLRVPFWMCCGVHTYVYTDYMIQYGMQRPSSDRWPSGCDYVVLLTMPSCLQNKNSPEGLEGTNRRFVQFGGGASQRQLDWIRAEILEAARLGQKVLMCCHLAFCPGSSPNACLLWNYEEMLEVRDDAAIRKPEGGAYTCLMGVYHAVTHQWISWTDVAGIQEVLDVAATMHCFTLSPFPSAGDQGDGSRRCRGQHGGPRPPEWLRA